MPVITAYPDGVFCWADLATPDVAGAKAFYGGLFGWTFNDIPMEGGNVYSMGQIDGRNVAGLGPSGADAELMPAFWTSYVKQGDLDAVAARVEAAGGAWLFPPTEVAEGRMALARDPSGAAFGIWQPKSHIGAELINVPGALAWNELQTRDTGAAAAFYTTVFKWTKRTGTHDYGLFYSGERMIGGLMQMDEHWADSVPANWAVYLQTADVAATVTRAGALGGTVVVPPMFVEGTGTFATLQDPQGGVFSVIQWEET